MEGVVSGGAKTLEQARDAKLEIDFWHRNYIIPRLDMIREIISVKQTRSDRVKAVVHLIRLDDKR